MKIQPDDLKQVWKHFFAHQDIQSRNILLEYYLPLVRYTAERLIARFPKCVEVDDLFSVGILGLMDAIERFDPDRNTKFESYCVLRIQGTILDDIRKKDWVPRLVRAQAQTLQRATSKLESVFGRTPTDQELAEELGMPMDEFYDFQQGANACALISLDTPLSGSDPDGEFSPFELIANPKSQNPFSEVHKRDFCEYVKKGFSRQEQMILMLYYFEQMTMKEIGLTLGISESRVCQLHTSIIARLREHMKASVPC